MIDLKLLDVIFFEKDIPEIDIISGSSCTVVHVYNKLGAFEVEFVEKNTGATERMMVLTQDQIEQYSEENKIMTRRFTKDPDPYHNFKAYKEEYVSINAQKTWCAFYHFLKNYIPTDEIFDEYCQFEDINQYEVFQAYLELVKDYMPLPAALTAWEFYIDQNGLLNNFIPV